MADEKPVRLKNAVVSLRVSPLIWQEKPRYEELLALLKEYRGTIGEVAFFTGFTHPPLPLQTLQQRAAALKELIPGCKALGLRTGINHLATLGHLDENLEHSLREPWQHLVDVDGAVSASCYCSSDPAVRGYLKDVYVSLAQARPDFIWVDDDVRLESHAGAIRFACFCERCLAQFSTESGATWTRDALKTALGSGPREQCLTLRRKWLTHNRRYITDLLAWIRAAVDTVDPALPLGLMTGEISYSGYGFDDWAKALSGTQRSPVKWRPGGGFYTDDTPPALLDKAHSTGRQVALLPASVTDVQSEHENFPYQRLKKSVTIFTAEIAAYIGAGCTGTALNCMGISSDPLAEYLPYFAAVKSQRGFYDKLVESFGRSPCEGLWPAFTPDSFAAQAPERPWFDAPSWGGNMREFNELSEIGLPMAHAQAGAAVTLFSGDSCLAFSREQLLQMLAGGVVLNGPALVRLHELGLGEHTGFAVRETKDRDTIEVLTGDAINGGYAGWHRDCRPSFWPQPSYLLKPLSATSRVLAEIVDFGPTNFGACSGVFENSLGGRVAVLGYYPWRSLHSLAKSSQMKALLRWLSRDTLPAYVSSFHKAAVWCRRDAAGGPALLVLNASIDTAEDLQICVRGGGESLRLLRADGHREHLPRKSEDGPYSMYRIERLGPWQAALVGS
ncbi:MAG: hypothetical protein NTW87_16220 [Planctomycetota bacterium]|nr:hypothetical protein [Planctomycetota bacterium]